MFFGFLVHFPFADCDGGSVWWMVSPRNTSSAILQIINHSASACSGLFWEISPLTALEPSKVH